ncbi:hypothetical protein KSP39_PZI008134 [Platanthera zijinensis]|uniref:Reverse transcriptase Ty1/copia-type domain-containing protein n=1 Tax=Platanthera zijinensis TaxID=2320716 RepID=A0AAP0G880_9ASPA
MLCTMDVTFRERESYFSSSTHDLRQGESSTTDDDVIAVPLPLLPSSSFIPSPPSTPVPRAPPISIPDSSTMLSPFPHVYHRRSGTQITAAPSLSVPTSDSDSDDIDLHMPLALLKKGKTTSTQHPISNHAAYHHLTPSHQTFVSSLSLVVIPKTWQEAFTIPAWTQAMHDEMSALDKNHTWDIFALPSGKKAIGSRWVFSVKQNQDGKVERYKTRLVAQGYTQTQGVDYQETFAPVAKMDSIRVLLSCVVCLD